MPYLYFNDILIVDFEKGEGMDEIVEMGKEFISLSLYSLAKFYKKCR